MFTPSQTSRKRDPNGLTDFGDSIPKKSRSSRIWDFFSSKYPRETFLLSDSGTDTAATLTTSEGQYPSVHDGDSKDSISHARPSPIKGR